MDNPWMPSPDEVREWANTTSDPWTDQPCEDWPLALSWAQHERAYLELASDECCPAREFMLFILYFVVGHAIHDQFKTVPQPVIEGFVRRGSEYSHPDIQRWQNRCWKLLRDPDTFNYDQWCGGDYAQITI